MKDFMSFGLRGAWGGALGGIIAWLLFYVLNFGAFWSLLLIFHPAVLVYLAAPGAIVGLTLWITTGRSADSLSAISRCAIGTGVVLALLVLLNIYQLAWHIDRLSLTGVNIFGIFQTMLIEAGFLGGAAGLACPSRREEILKETSNTTYWERVALYEMAEREAQLAREKRAYKVKGEV